MRTSGRRHKPWRADRSVHAKGGLERLEQNGVAEWLVKAFHSTLFEQAWTNALISVSSDEDDRNLMPAAGQFALEVGSGHARRHGDIEDKTSGLVDVLGCKERFRRGEGLGCISELSNQVG